MRPAHVLCDIRLQRAQSNYISTIPSSFLKIEKSVPPGTRKRKNGISPWWMWSPFWPTSQRQETPAPIGRFWKNVWKRRAQVNCLQIVSSWKCGQQTESCVWRTLPVRNNFCASSSPSRRPRQNRSSCYPDIRITAFIPKKRLSGLIEQTGGIPTELRRMPPI